MAKTLFEKIWEKHIVKTIPDGPDVLYIDTHFVHEVTSPQAFKSLEDRGVSVLRPKQVVATADHNIPTINQHLPITDKLSATQVQQLTDNCKKHNIELYGLGHAYNGIVHVIGPELGITQPGMTIVCGDSHTSTHGAFGTIAFGIGTSEVEMVLATQCLLQNKPRLMRIHVDGMLGKGVTAKDVILHIISKISFNGATGYFVEFAGSTIRAMSMEARMTVCNMSIEMGARGGLIAPDEVTFSYMKGRKHTPVRDAWPEKIAEWRRLQSDKNAVFDKEIYILAKDIQPMITYGTNPGMGISIKGKIPTSAGMDDNGRKVYYQCLAYMDFAEEETLLGKKVDYIFIGSCTNSRIEDLRQVASFIKGKKKADDVEVWIVPGSRQVEKQAIEEGIQQIFEDAGFKLRQPGCSACLAMNDDKIPAGKYCISTSNRNFEGRQGAGARTLLASPLTAAASAITGYITDVREYIN